MDETMLFDKVGSALSRLGIKPMSTATIGDMVTIRFVSKNEAKLVGRWLRALKYEEITIRPASCGFALTARYNDDHDRRLCEVRETDVVLSGLVDTTMKRKTSSDRTKIRELLARAWLQLRGKDGRDKYK